MRREFEYRSVNAEQQFAINAVRETASTFADTIESFCPGANKYRAKALTDLEVVVMLANKAITHG